MENKTNWWMIIGVIVVVAFLASFITLQVTGNVIGMNNPDRTACVNSCYAEKCANLSTSRLRTTCRRTCTSSCSKVEVYTKAEVDALIKQSSGCSAFDFNCDNRLTMSDYNVIAAYWRDGTKITMNATVGAKCSQLVDFLAPYWQQNLNGGQVTMNDANLVKNKINECQEMGIKYI